MVLPIKKFVINLEVYNQYSPFSNTLLPFWNSILHCLLCFFKLINTTSRTISNAVYFKSRYRYLRSLLEGQPTSFQEKKAYLFHLPAISLQKSYPKALSVEMKLFLASCSLGCAVASEVSDNPLTVSAEVANIRHQEKVLPRIPCLNLQLFGKTNRT